MRVTFYYACHIIVQWIEPHSHCAVHHIYDAHQSNFSTKFSVRRAINMEFCFIYYIFLCLFERINVKVTTITWLLLIGWGFSYRIENINMQWSVYKRRKICKLVYSWISNASKITFQANTLLWNSKKLHLFPKEFRCKKRVYNLFSLQTRMNKAPTIKNVSQIWSALKCA